ncbi:MAG: polysaccharide biosynthesis protein [Nitrospinaceae bacterium]|jgi:FlaA1/EpsC-like NDP-sugar epimerase|nr:polysaccharide biosynthesis protein [Nitrospinaceae bacterium]MBT5369756.1 polysaccharide biosynthesis protein [Nitrospinaceae bacterium]MBT6395753.1 polysaccharide biosynthesis protein [Nitrospinaceae bacterium]
MALFNGKRILVTGGTGSFGKAMVRNLLSNRWGNPKEVTVFSRDEAKQHEMRMSYMEKEAATEEIIYENFKNILKFRIGDIRDYESVLNAVQNVDIVINAAALKQVPTCEYFPGEAVRTNVEGVMNLVRAVNENNLPIEAVVGVSTDKACKPINVMGMTKALMERFIINACLMSKDTRFMCVRYGNVIASRGSVIPLFLNQIKSGGPVTITTDDMTRFLITLDRAVETVVDAISGANRGDIYVPKITSYKVTDLAEVLINGKDIPIEFTGIRPGEKIHEILVSEEECYRTIEKEKYYVVQSILPEVSEGLAGPSQLAGEYSSKDTIVGKPELKELLSDFIPR